MPPGRPGRRWGRRLCMALPVAAVLVLAVARWPREPRLMAHAVRAADVRGWWQDDVRCPYVWISDTVLFSHSGWWRLHKPFLYDTAARHRTSLDRLDRLCNAGDLNSGWELSPDGRWVLCIPEFADEVRAAQLDGSGYRRWKVRHPTEIAWREDSRRWVACGYRNTVLTQGGVVGYTDPYAVTGSVDGPAGAVPSSLDEAVSILQRRDDVVSVPSGEREVRLRLPPREDAPSRWIAVETPPDSALLEAVPDRAGRRIALLFHARTVSPLDAMLRRLWRGYRARERYAVSLWVCRMDGSEMHTVGSVATGPDPGGAGVPCHPGWLPGGRKVSFVRRDTLWIVPVER